MLMKFEGEDVTIMSDTKVQGFNDKTETQAGERVTSKFTLIADQGPVLSFSTYNVLIHYWSEPKGGLDVDGYAGDFEFVITDARENEVTLKGKKHGTIMHMTKLANDVDWDAYIAACNKIRTESEEYGTLVGFKGETTSPHLLSRKRMLSHSAKRQAMEKQRNAKFPLHTQTKVFDCTALLPSMEWNAIISYGTMKPNLSLAQVTTLSN